MVDLLSERLHSKVFFELGHQRDVVWCWTRPDTLALPAKNCPWTGQWTYLGSFWDVCQRFWIRIISIYSCVCIHALSMSTYVHEYLCAWAHEQNKRVPFSWHSENCVCNPACSSHNVSIPGQSVKLSAFCRCTVAATAVDSLRLKKHGDCFHPWLGGDPNHQWFLSINRKWSSNWLL